jgi:hypothetical protein
MMLRVTCECHLCAGCMDSRILTELKDNCHNPHLAGKKTDAQRSICPHHSQGGRKHSGKYTKPLSLASRLEPPSSQHRPCILPHGTWPQWLGPISHSPHPAPGFLTDPGRQRNMCHMVLTLTATKHFRSWQRKRLLFPKTISKTAGTADCV